MAKKIIALFVEGPTEKEFYKAVVKTIHSQLDCAFGCEIQYIDMKGIGNYKRAALRKYNDLQNKNSGAYIYPFLCIDSDVFEFNKKPPFNKKEVIIIIYIWKYCGFCVILFTAGLANVNHSLYESAQLDGANSFQLVTRITIPLITPTTFFVSLMEIIYSFKIFREVFALFGEYPNKNVYFLQNYINNNYYNLNYPRLSSASIIMSVMIIALMFVFFMFERKYSYSE